MPTLTAATEFTVRATVTDPVESASGARGRRFHDASFEGADSAPSHVDANAYRVTYFAPLAALVRPASALAIVSNTASLPVIA